MTTPTVPWRTVRIAFGNKRVTTVDLFGFRLTVDDLTDAPRCLWQVEHASDPLSFVCAQGVSRDRVLAEELAAYVAWIEGGR